MTTHFFGLTDTGKSRGNNEDSFVAEEKGDNQLVLAAVIDGVGGYHGGEVAAAITKDVFAKQAVKPRSAIITNMIATFRAANKAILDGKSSEPEHAEMACVATLVVADIENNQFYYAHVGDTRLYLYRDGSLVKISKDHSFVGFLEDSGRLDENAAMTHPKRNEINKAIGFSDQIDTDESYIETGQSPFLPGDLLLLCSDGLTDMVDRDGIVSMLSQGDSLEIKASNLVNLANENGGRDNITVVLVQNPKKAKEITPAKYDSIVTPDPLPVERPIAESIEHSPKPSRTKHWYGFTALIILCLILLASTILLYHNNQQNSSGDVAHIDTIKPQRNSQEQLLQDAFNHTKGDTLVLSDSIFKSPILISDTLHINRDSLFIIAKGMILQADTNYSGAAIVINGQHKVIGFDSLNFNGFATAISLSNTRVLLKGVSFINCKIPVQNNYSFANQVPVTVQIPFTTTLPNRPKNLN
ncbi:PP2C family protein-serine/threonine phosphatase [Pedobacter insulae]|uniref:Serine/threonine protein phosphatase PrpC n=1 Tax=Pedobacter insulae TaxID=414048 RepID=A0A1I2X1C5_9SPHI|nr:protein phosphatase 2C domain-containing protein [Pedobacter insulae]SFH05741.1 Serine/threonine protein phosphatase PrpC [Pedobacter insulae]